MWGPPVRAFLPPLHSSLPGHPGGRPGGTRRGGWWPGEMGGCRWGFSWEQRRGSAALGLSEEEGEGAAPAVTHGRGEVRASIRVQPSRRDRQRSGKKRETAERRPDAPRDKEPTVALIPDSGIAWELRAVKTCSSHIGGLTAGLWLGTQAGGAPPGGGLGARLLPGARQGRRSSGQHAAGSPKGEGQRCEAQAPLCPQASCGERGVVRGCSTQDAQHQQVFEEFAGPSGLPSSSSSSAKANSWLARVRRPSSSFLWACSTSSVRRVKDWESKEHSWLGISLSSPVPLWLTPAPPPAQAGLICSWPLSCLPLHWTQPRNAHLFNVEVGAGTCFVEVHAILSSQLQEKNIPERESAREGRCPAAPGTSSCQCTQGPCYVSTISQEISRSLLG